MTSFSLRVQNIKNLDKFLCLQQTLSEYDLICYVFNDGVYDKDEHEAQYNLWEEQKWHNGNGVMIKISELFPEMIFELTCNNKGNFWRIYYKDGETETCSGDVVFERPRKIKWNDCFTS